MANPDPTDLRARSKTRATRDDKRQYAQSKDKRGFTHVNQLGKRPDPKPITRIKDDDAE